MKPFLLPALLTAALTTALPAPAAPPPGGYAHKPIPGASPEPLPAAAGPTDAREFETFVDGIMAAHLQQNHLAGATVAAVKDGKLFFAKGYGFADVDKQLRVDAAQTLFRPGSVSKLFTWTAVMQLVEQGKLDLDADVNKYLTQFQLPEAHGAPVTLRNLLTHTPGFEDGALGYLIIKDPASIVPLADSLKAHIPTRVRPPTTDFADGTNASYSNWGTSLAGLIVANVSGLEFDEYLEKNIFAPLQMASSTFREPLPAALAPRMSNGHVWKGGKWKAKEFEIIHNFGPAGSMSATATDMANFMIAHLNQGAFGDARILKPETAALMHSRQFSPSPHINGSGLGFYESWRNGRRLICHAGDTQYFHSDLSLLPEGNFGLFVSYNTSHEAGPGIARRDLLGSIMDRYYPAKLPPAKPPADFKERAGRYAGQYRYLRHSYTKFEKMFGLLGSIKVVPTEDNTLLVAGGAEATQWVEVAPDVFRQVDRDNMIAFVARDGGEVTHLLGTPLAFIGAYKLAWYQTPGLHYFLLGLGVLAFIAAILGALRHWREDRTATPPARRARRLAALTGVVQIAFLALAVGVLATALDDLGAGIPPAFKAALLLPLLAVPLTLALLYFAVRAWRERWWTGWGRVQYTVIALASAGFLASLHFWNLLGWRFG